WLQFDYSQPCPHVKGKTKGEVLAEGVGSGVDVEALDDLMMEEKVSQVTRNGIRFLGAQYWDEALYALTGQVIVKYSLFDLSYIKVYDLKGNFICTANRRESIHPMARVLGTSRDMEELKRQISEQRRLEKKTVEGLRELLKGKKDIKLDWQAIAETSPKMIDKLAKDEIELPAIEERIPDEAVLPAKGIKSEQSESIPERPFFENAIQRYEWHLRHG
ncbi:MAG: Mu transposase C-terminal domain-containing protein, partial [Hydrogenobacter thermophilus]|nr:Mu transposase C-terminal domain-containing protein [Hydrogenobacter thermophilus]